ncbi:MAG: hypothetical protein Q9227_001729 [Pyrenula ochraceoflavens]
MTSFEKRSSQDNLKKRGNIHPYLAGNFAPLRQIQPLTPCSHSGSIPEEVCGGEYVRNGGNPVTNEDLGRDAHWFDGDGMLSGVSFRRTEKGVQPEFVNQFILTDIYLASITSSFLRIPILPSIATLVNPLSSLFNIIYRTIRTIILVILSRLPGSLQAIKRISVANTGVLYHDGRALATCESGPPMRIALPGLETVGWFNGKKAEGERGGEEGAGFGGDGLLGFMKEWTTAHPRIDPRTGELLLFHSTFAPPFIHYSTIPASHPPTIPTSPLALPTRLLNAAVPGVSSARMMHDFGVSFDHTVIMDLPLSLDPLNLARNKPVVSYDPNGRSRFGVFPRYQPDQIRWFETGPCCIFHTANTWDDATFDPITLQPRTTSVNMLACRLTSASLVFTAGNLPIPTPPVTSSFVSREEEQCRLYYYRFMLSSNSQKNTITDQFALSRIPFEFPSLREDRSMSAARYIYGCSVSHGTFSAALGRAVKIDLLVKMNVETLIARGKKDSCKDHRKCVDNRSVEEVLSSTDPNDPIQAFQLPPNHFAQEPRFVPRKNGLSEDDGWLLTYVFDESQLAIDGSCPPDAKSELWIIDAKGMKEVVAKIHLPQRVPYGLHGNWFSDEQVKGQRPFESVRTLPTRSIETKGRGLTRRAWVGVRRRIEKALG